VRVERTPGFFASIRQVVTTVAGTYTAEFSVKIEGPLNKCRVSLTGQTEQLYDPATTQDWVKYRTTFTTEGVQDFVRIVVTCDASPQSGIVWFDNVTLTQIA
jgi:hypothetical protein